MADLKTKPTEEPVEAFLESVPDVQRRQDAFSLLEIMRRATGLEPEMWGSAIVGFGRYHYVYASGHSGDACLMGFSPRKQNLVLYITPGFEQYDELMQRLGKHSTGKGCLYLKKLADVDLAVLETLLARSFAYKRTLIQEG